MFFNFQQRRTALKISGPPSFFRICQIIYQVDKPEIKRQTKYISDTIR